MKKAKAVDKETGRKPAKTRSSRSKKPVDLGEVRKDITNMVGSQAMGMAEAVVDEALKGELAPMKYLFEVSGLYPAAPGTEAKSVETSLAHTLLKRLGLPTEPVVSPDDDLGRTINLSETAGSPVKGTDAVPRDSNSSRDESARGAIGDAGNNASPVIS